MICCGVHEHGILTRSVEVPKRGKGFKWWEVVKKGPVKDKGQVMEDEEGLQ